MDDNTATKISKLVNLYAIYYKDFSDSVELCSDILRGNPEAAVLSEEFKEAKRKRFLNLRCLKDIGADLEDFGITPNLHNGYEYLMEE